MRIFLFVLISSFFFSTMPIQAQSYKKMWKEVEAFEKKDLPKSVLESARAIYQKAKAEQDAPQMMKAYLTMMNTRYQITPDSLETDIEFLKKWAETEKDSVDAAVLYSILGEIVMQKSPQEAMEYLLRSLQPVTELGDCSAESYVPLVENGEASVLFEGNKMYPMLAHRALDLMRNNRYRLARTDVNIEKQIAKIYTGLLSYFSEKGERAAYVLTRLAEIDFSIDAYPANLRLEAYQQLIDSYGEVETCAEVFLNKAKALRRDMKQKEALEVLEKGIKTYPKFQRINALKDLVQEIKAPEIRLQMETLYPGKPEPLRVFYRNLSGFDVKIYRTDVKDIEKIATYKKDDPFWKGKWMLYRTDHYTLKPTDDYETKDTLLTITMPEEGYYLFEAVPGKAYSGKFESEQALGYVSALGIIVSDLYYGKRKAMVVDRMTGHAVEGAKVEFYQKEGNTYTLNPGTLTADKNGLTGWGANRAEKLNRMTYVRATTPEHPCMPLVNCWEYDVKITPEGKSTSMSLFTDRNLYRPGQMVYVSGILFGNDADSLYVKEGRDVKLVLRDVNNKQISEAMLRTNGFGSFTTSFALPSTCLPGFFSIVGEEGGKNRADIRFRVEEYKRPLFEVNLEPVKEAYVLGDTVYIRGKAQMFTGMPVQGADVRFQVESSIRLRMPEGGTPLRQSGIVRTDSTGAFVFPVVLGKKSLSSLPYRYEIYQYTAEVTTEAGDTQSAQGSISADMNPYQIGIIGVGETLLKDYPQPMRFAVSNKMGIPVKKEVRYEVFELSPLQKGVDRKTGKCVLSGSVVSNTEFAATDMYRLPSGNYRLKISVEGEQKEQTEFTDFSLFSLSDKSLPSGIDIFLYSTNTEFGEKAPVLYFGTSMKEVDVFCNIYTGKGEILVRHFALSDSIRSFSFPYKELYGEMVSVSYAFMKEGILYQRQTTIRKPLPDKKLTLKWQTFRDKLQAGAKEEWKLRITDSKGELVNSELLATLYDASLDKIYSRALWNIPLYLQRYMPYLGPRILEAGGRSLSIQFPIVRLPYKDWTYTNILSPFAMRYRAGGIVVRGMASANAKFRLTEEVVISISEDKGVVMSGSTVAFEEQIAPTASSNEALTLSSNEVVRQNFAETAFFYPQLRTNEKGEVDIVFTLPESLTTWRFMGLAHTKEMDYGTIDTTVVASKEFMLQANLPRFVRVGDTTSLSATLSNVSGKTIKGTVRMELFDPFTEKVFYTKKQSFKLDTDRTSVVSFMYDITDTYKVMACRMVAEGDGFSDGEQHLLPVLNNKERITESVSVSMNQPGTKTVELNKLFNDQSPTATDRHLTVEFTGNPSWLAVLALPSIGVPSHQDAYSLAAAYYSSSLASWIIDKYPRIRTMFEAWQSLGGGKDVFLSELQRNPELKDLLLEASPFLLEAESEAEQRRRLGALFDLNTLQNQKAVYLNKLAGLQSFDGGWSWYEGMDANLYMTTSIVETLLRLNALTGTTDKAMSTMLTKGLDYLDKQAVKEYQSLRKQKENRGLSEFASHYLYIATLSGRTLTGDTKSAYRYFMEKLKTNVGNLTIYGKAVGAIVLAANGMEAESKDFMNSLLQYSVYTPEMGRYYDTNIALSTWSDYRIPTQSMVIEALYKLGGNGSGETISQMQQWLLKQKQVQSWDTPINTVNAIYAFLLDNASILSEQAMPELFLDGKQLSTAEASLGLNSVKETFSLSAGTKAPQRFTVRKESDGLSWGAVYAQYLESMDKVSAQSEGLSITRTLYAERLIDGKLRWVEVKEGETLQVGDKVKSVLRLRTDRNMDFVQMKENRASCMEPASVLSGYRFGGGIGYYQAIKDASMEYYIDRLPKGTYTIESIYYITMSGTYEMGSVQVQSAYAPEFNAHTAGWKLKVD